MNKLPVNRLSAAKAWMQALANIAPLERRGIHTLPRLLVQMAGEYGTRTAIEDENEHVSYSELARRTAYYAAWTMGQELPEGGVVCLMMPNCAEFLAMWLGITSVGRVAALINTTLAGDSLVHAIRVARSRHLIFDAEFSERLNEIVGRLPEDLRCLECGRHIVSSMNQPVDQSPFSGYTPVSAHQTALLIFTSGTTGLPKAARVSHYRILEWSLWFSGMLDTTHSDRLYNCLPMYHSTGGVAGIGAVLVRGGTVILRKRFSAQRFWKDIRDCNCTLFLYIGELCRYLLNVPKSDLDGVHSLRLSFGNGLGGDTWRAFTERFKMPQVLEFYASTEGNVALYNCEGKIGAIGRVPPFLAHRFPIALIKTDPITLEPERGEDRFCHACAADVVGEAIGKIVFSDEGGTRSFEGYTDEQSTSQKILRDVFTSGDAWFRTGDLMRRDRKGFFYFVDRLGDTFRWKGENVSSTEVAEIVGRCPGITGSVVYGVKVQGNEGRAGMAAITIGPEFNLVELFRLLTVSLPVYARPLFVRVCTELASTATFKTVKTRLMSEAYDPTVIDDQLYYNDQASGCFRTLDALLYLRLTEILA